MRDARSLSVGSLFSGIGGMDLGFERAGFSIAWQCEIDPFCRKVLAKHWHGIPCHEDVKNVSARSVPGVDCIIGGFPCQPVSVAGSRRGDQDDRWMWPHMLRIVRELRPRWICVENVPGLRTLGADRVLEDLEEVGYTVWPLVVGANDVGAPHRRKRVWFVAHCNPSRLGDANPEGRPVTKPNFQEWIADTFGTGLVNANGPRRQEAGCRYPLDAGSQSQPGCSELGNAESDDERRKWTGSRGQQIEDRGSGSRWPSRPGEPQHGWEAPRTTQPGLGRATDGISRRLANRNRRDKLKALGNAVVPQVAEMIARAILETMPLFRTERHHATISPSDVPKASDVTEARQEAPR